MARIMNDREAALLRLVRVYAHKSLEKTDVEDSVGYEIDDDDWIEAGEAAKGSGE